MSKSFEEVVNQFSSPTAEWQVFINGTEYSDNIDYFEFTFSLNTPVKTNAKLSGIPGSSVDTLQGQEIVIKKQDVELFRGVVQEANNKFLGGAMVKAAGYTSELDKDSQNIVENMSGVENPFKGSTASEIINTLVQGSEVTVSDPNTDTTTVKTYSTSFDFPETVNVEDFRVKETQLDDLNRLMGEYGLEWYITFDSNDEPVFNVTDTIVNAEADGSPIGTFSTSGADQNAREISQNTNKNKGSYEGVVVRGYGDGDDQVTASAKTANIVGADASADEFTVEEFVSLSSSDRVFVAAQQGFLANNQNKGEYTVSSTNYDPGNDETTVTVNEDVTADEGGLLDFDGAGKMIYLVDQVGDARTKIFTDKTILSQSEADERALNYLKTKSTAWREITVKPMNSNKMYGLGSVFQIDDDKAKISGGYRIVESYYKIRFDNNESESKIHLSNKPQTFYDDFSNLEATNKSQTDYSQGSRNTISESNKEVVGPNNPLKLDFNIPSRFTESISGSDETAQVRLDYVVDDYIKQFQASEISATDDSTSEVFTEVTNFGDLERVYTERRSEATDGNDATFADLQETGIENTAVTLSDSFNIQEQLITVFGQFKTVASEAIGNANSGVMVHIYLIKDNPQTTDASKMWFRLERDSDGAKYPGSSGLIMPIYQDWEGSPACQTTIYVPEDMTGEDLNIQAALGTGAPDPEGLWQGAYTFMSMDATLPATSDGGDNVEAYTADSNGDRIFAGEDAAQSQEDLPNKDTVSFDKLDNQDVVLQEVATAADQLTIRVNGSEIPDSPQSLSGNTPFKNSDLNIPLTQLNTPGDNTLELEPNNTAFSKANIIIDHKLEAERE